ncbi:RNA-directed DNA polymerase (reverse transcriptase)-related family protein [Raphanus sativus]|nr:RNA-directed DNA polymerase (reverse transcriptase)-related family protein [Raphanus sativus]
MQHPAEVGFGVASAIGSGISASFWFENWTGMGPLIEIVGSLGPMLSGLSISASVADALRHDGWWLAHSRSRNPTLVLLKNCLPDAAPILQSENDDTFLWNCGNSHPKASFSSSETWQTLHPQGPVVSWCDQVWFAGRIPKHAMYLSPPSLFEDGLRWLKDHTRDKNLMLITRLFFQASIYHIWKERNSRLHNGIARQAQVVIKDIK